MSVTKGRLCDSRVRDHVIVHLGLNVSSSAHDCGCLVNGGKRYGSNLNIIIIIHTLSFVSKRETSFLICAK